MVNSEPDPRAQADIEATETIRSQEARKNGLKESAARFSNVEYTLFRNEVWRHREEIKELIARLSAAEAALEKATSALAELEIETVCCVCGAHLSGPKKQPIWKQSHSICSDCLPAVFDVLESSLNDNKRT